MLPDLDIERRLQAVERFMREIHGDRGATADTTWTPVFSGSGTAGTFIYTAQNGYYTLAGNRCFINGLIATSSFSVAPTLDMRITGLPFPASADTNNYSVIVFRTHLLDFDAGFTYAVGQINPVNQFMYIVECGDNVASAIIQGTTFDNQAAVNIAFAGFYKI